MAQETRHNLRSLADSPGWAFVAKVLKDQLSTRQKDLDAPSEGMDGMVRKEYTTGERAGIMLALGLPSLLLNGIEEEIEALKLEIEEENDEKDTEGQTGADERSGPFAP